VLLRNYSFTQLPHCPSAGNNYTNLNSRPSANRCLGTDVTKSTHLINPSKINKKLVSARPTSILADLEIQKTKYGARYLLTHFIGSVMSRVYAEFGESLIMHAVALNIDWHVVLWFTVYCNCSLQSLIAHMPRKVPITHFRTDTSLCVNDKSVIGSSVLYVAYLL